MTPTSYSPGAFTKSAVIVGSAKPQPPVFIVRRRHVVGVISAVLGLLLLYLFGYEPGYHGTLVIPVPRPLILAHATVSETAAANSSSAVEQALQTGMDGIDLGRQRAGGGELISGQTFESLVRAVKGRGLLIVELDAPGLAPSGIERRAVEVIQKYDAHLSVVLGSFNPLVLYRVKRADPLVRTVLIFADGQQGSRVAPPWVLRQEFIRRAVRKFVRVDMLSINHQVDEAVIERLIAKGWPSFIWTPNNETDIRRALGRQPYGLISDQPVLARQLRGE